MAILIPGKRFYRQPLPSEPVFIAPQWRKDFAYAVIGNRQTAVPGLVGGRFGGQKGYAVVPSKFGTLVGRKFAANGSGDTLGLNTFTANATGLVQPSYLAIVYPQSPQAWAGITVHADRSGLIVTATGLNIRRVHASGVYYNTIFSPEPTLTNNAVNVVVATAQSTAGSYVGNHRVVVNNALFWNTTSEYVSSTQAIGGASLIGQDSYDTSRTWVGTIPLVVCWNRSLSDAELYALSYDPWQVFVTRSFYSSRAIWLDSAAAGGDATVTPTAISALAVAKGVLTSSADVSVALTGVAATAAAGSLSPGIAVALTGQAVTVAAGTATPSISTALVGKTATVGLGAIAPAISTVLAGQVAALARGLLTPGIQFTLSGQATTVAAGTLATTLSSALTGTTVTVAAPTSISSSLGGDAEVVLVGTFASVAAGTLASSVSLSPALTGTTATVGAGTLATTLATALTGTTATVSRGALASTLSVALAGTSVSVAVPASIDSEVAGSPTAALTTKLVTVTPGVLTSSASVTVALVGQAVSAGRGAISAVPELSVALIGASVGVARGTLSPGLAALLAGSTIVVTPGLIGVQTEASATFELVGQSVTVSTGNFVLLVPTIQALKYPLFVTTKVDDLVV